MPIKLEPHSSSDLLPTADPGKQEVVGGQITHQIGQVDTSIIGPQARGELFGRRQVQIGKEDWSISHPKRSNARPLLLVLLPTFVILLALSVRFQTEINELVSRWLPILQDLGEGLGRLIHSYWP